MKPNEFIKVKVWDDVIHDWHDITSGILSIDTKDGSDVFEGFWDQPDTGQFVITSRGSTADPHLHSYIKNNSIIKICTSASGAQIAPIFYGFITDVNVKYNKNDKQTVTINGTDLMGYLNRLVVTQDFIDTNITPTYPDALVPVDYLLTKTTFALSPTMANFFFISYGLQPFSLLDPSALYQTIPNAPIVKVEPGKTLYELIITGMSSGLIRYNCTYGNQYDFMPYFKYDSTFYTDFWNEQMLTDQMYFVRTNDDDPWQDEYPDNHLFSQELTYKQITLNNGLNKIINQVSVSNTDPHTAENLFIDPLSNDTSILNYGPARLDAITTYTTTSNPFWLASSTIAGQAAEFQNNIIDYQSTPSVEIESITIDGALHFYYGNQVPANGNRIFIQHKLENGTYIKGYYVITGVRHSITESNWIIELLLRKSEYKYVIDNRIKTPTINLSKTTATTAENITASISNYTTQDWANVEKVEWMVNFVGGLNQYLPGNPPSEIFVQKQGWDVPIFTGNTVTWHYDDQGPLKKYANYGSNFVGPGNYEVQVWVTGKNGLVTTGREAYISVTGATAHADFTFNTDAYGVTTFIDASGGDTNTWEWNFGDGTTYSGQNPPPKTYSAAGTYTVTLTVNNGYDFDSVVKTVTITSITIPVKYVRFRFQGTVTKPAGQADYTTDLIDTIGGFRIRNTSNTDTGGIQPIYITSRTLNKVQDIAAQTYTGGYPVGTTIPPAPPYTNATSYTEVSTTQPWTLNPMSQSYWSGWSTALNNLGGGVMPKYKFHPVITNNPDGSQTKTYDFDLIIDYSYYYLAPTNSDYYDQAYPSYPYSPGGNESYKGYWAQWGAGGSTYDQRYKISTIVPYAAIDWIVENSAQTITYDRYGTKSGKTYLPITISVSADGITYRKVGTATFTGPGAATVSYLQSMPPKSTLPIEA